MGGLGLAAASHDGNSMTTNPWKEKARALDRYRWRLLRERHGWLGSAVRFLRDAIIETLYGLVARFRLERKINQESSDFLLLHSSARMMSLRRKQALIDALNERGYCLIETALPQMPNLLASRKLQRPPYKVPVRYFIYAAHAVWLVQKFQPRILLNDRNGSFYSPFLRLALNAEKHLLVQLAHSTTVEGSRRLGMNDYDYYFLFGRSSLEALKQRKLRFGTCMAVLAGSHLIDESYALPAPDPALKTLLILGIGPDKEKLPVYQATYAMLRDWAERHPEYKVIVKPHPRSYSMFWSDAARAIPNIQVLLSRASLADALKMTSVVVNIVSNAAIEAALTGRPVLFVNCANNTDILCQERFFGTRIGSLADLEYGVRSIEEHYAEACARSTVFAEYHLAYGTLGVKRNVLELERLLQGKAPEAQAELIENTV
jgi:hypothetical protein